MDDAWQSDMAPTNTGISIPSQDPALSATDEGGYREQRRSSRSRSPGAKNGDRGRSGGGHNPGNNLHVSGLSRKVDARDLEAAFAKIGRVQKASVMLDPHTRDSRGFGFVTMETAEEADAAVTALNGTDFMGKNLVIEKARRGRARTPTPGKYYGPPKRGGGSGYERPYDPRPYDSRYARDHDDRRGGPRGGRDYDRGYRDRDHDRGRDYDRGGRGDSDRGADRGGGGADRGGVERGGGDRGGGDRARYDDRRY